MVTDNEKQKLIEALMEMTGRVRTFASQQGDIDLLMLSTIVRAATILYRYGRMETLIDFAERLEHFALATLSQHKGDENV